MAYAEVVDLVLGNVPVPPDAQKYVDDAAEEIDSYIGFRYATPVDVASLTLPDQRPVVLLLKRINAWLASGRLILAADAGGADDQVHQYGKYLVDQAVAAITQITDGTIILLGVASASVDQVILPTGPVAAFADDASAVEAFNSTFGNPASTAIQRPFILTGNPYTY